MRAYSKARPTLCQVLVGEGAGTGAGVLRNKKEGARDASCQVSGKGKLWPVEFFSSC